MKEFACSIINLVRQNTQGHEKSKKKQLDWERDNRTQTACQPWNSLDLSKSYSKAFKAWFNLSTTGEQTKLPKQYVSKWTKIFERHFTAQVMILKFFVLPDSHKTFLTGRTISLKEKWKEKKMRKSRPLKAPPNGKKVGKGV